MIVKCPQCKKDFNNYEKDEKSRTFKDFGGLKCR